MQKGDVVMIFEDPFTETKPEGKAELVKKIGGRDPELEHWIVRFIDDDFKTNRLIKVKDEEMGRLKREFNYERQSEGGA